MAAVTGSAVVPAGLHRIFRVKETGFQKPLDEFVVRLPYGDIDAVNELFDNHGDDLAAVMTVPYDWNEHVGHEFLKVLREKCTKNGTVLIFDQVLTGFRLAKGGRAGIFRNHSGYVNICESYCERLPAVGLCR